MRMGRCIIAASMQPAACGDDSAHPPIASPCVPVSLDGMESGCSACCGCEGFSPRRASSCMSGSLAQSMDTCGCKTGPLTAAFACTDAGAGCVSCPGCRCSGSVDLYSKELCTSLAESRRDWLAVPDCCLSGCCLSNDAPMSCSRRLSDSADAVMAGLEVAQPIGCKQQGSRAPVRRR